MANTVIPSFGGSSPAITNPVSSAPTVTIQNYTPPRPSAGSGRDYIDSGDYSSPPAYPNTSWRAYKAWKLDHPGYHGINGYQAWKDYIIGEYNTAYNIYQQNYDSAKSQFNRWIQSGLNPNLAYGSITPGSSAGQAFTGSNVQDPLQIAAGYAQVAESGASVLSGVFGNLKTLAEAADIVARLPESRFKGQLSKQLNVAAAAGAINNEHAWLGQVNGARVSLGVGVSKAQAEKQSSILQGVTSKTQTDLLEFLSSHDFEGSETDFSGSALVQGALSGEESKSVAVQLDKLAYDKNKAEFDNLFSKPEYFAAVLNKMQNDAYISYSEAYAARQIINSPGNSAFDKALMLQKGLPGLIFKLIGFINSEREDKKSPSPKPTGKPGDPNRKPGTIPDNSNWPEGIFNH